MMLEKPLSEACVRNQAAILTQLRPLLTRPATVLEVGSGTGQHAIHFAAALPHIVWQSSDLPVHHPGIRAWLDEAGLPNTPPPLALDVWGDWPARRFDAVFSANTLHIMSAAGVEQFFAGVGAVLHAGGLLVVYGPFNEHGVPTSESNRAFDTWLRARDPDAGLRDIGWLATLARKAGLTPQADHTMPANNRLLVWARHPGKSDL
jgi:cyclopropane fatty-acyl-phospholipid synthase-like methyltransferase